MFRQLGGALGYEYDDSERGGSMKLEMVTWYDHEHGDTGWATRKETKKWAKSNPPTFKSVGWLIYENDSHVVLVGTIDVDTTSGGIKILKSAIITRWGLNYGKEINSP